MRIDRYLVDTGAFESRAQAQAAIKAGKVRVDGRVVRKASESVPEGARVEAAPAHPWVGRGALKLLHALEMSGIDVAGRTCLDVGASTGGFTEVLLSRGAARVFSVDVGHGQLHPSLRGDPRVVVMEGCDARELSAEAVGHPGMVVCDASFIPLAKVLERPLSLAKAGAWLVALVKPQFEVGRAKVGRGGVVRDAGARDRAVGDAVAWLSGQGWSVEGMCESPVRGGSGNVESLIWARKGL